MRYCVYGSSSDLIHTEYLEGGRELGRCLARHGHGLVFGGGNHGMMGAAARGINEIRQETGMPIGSSKAKQSISGEAYLAWAEREGITGPEIIGISPSFFNEEGILYDHCTCMIYTETMRERKQKMEEFSDGFIITPGGLGTLDEFFEIATLRQLGQHGKPVAILNLRGYYDAMEAMLVKAAAEQFIGADTMEVLRFFREPEELVCWIEKQQEAYLDWRATKYGRTNDSDTQ